MADAGTSLAGFRARLAAAGAAVPGEWLALLLGSPDRWLPATGAVSPLSGAPTTPQAWALLVASGLVQSCGGRLACARGRALVFDLASAAAPMGVRGAVARRPVDDAVQKSAWVRERLRRTRPGEGAAACLLALEACGALAATPAVVEQARWRLGPGAEASDAEAIGALVADVVWHCQEDAAALLGELARRA